MAANVTLKLSTQLQPEVATLRRRLQQLNVWPDAGDQFLMLLAQACVQTDVPTPADNEWLSRVANDALNSCDIGARYPAFFQKLLRCPTLVEAFINELDRQDTH